MVQKTNGRRQAVIGCLFGIYSTEEKRLIAILKHLDCATKAQFLKLKEALRYRNDHILDSEGKRQLTIQKLVCLNDIINGCFYTQINKYSFYEPIWTHKKNSNISSDKQGLEQCVRLYNFYTITEERLLEEIIPVFLIGCRLKSKILFF